MVVGCKRITNINDDVHIIIDNIGLKHTLIYNALTYFLIFLLNDNSYSPERITITETIISISLN